jgi:hypothetical protein
MSNLELPTLIDCLDVVCAIHAKERTEMMTDFYFEALSDLEDRSVTKAFKTIVDDRYFPRPARIRELATGIVHDADWIEILYVASGQKESATISGISDLALKTIGGLRKIATTDEDKTHYLKAQWLKLVSIPADPNSLLGYGSRMGNPSDPTPLLGYGSRMGNPSDPTPLLGYGSRMGNPSDPTPLPPATAIIRLEPVKNPRPNDTEYVDDDFSIRTASMMRVIKEKGAISAAWVSIINSFPDAKRREVYQFAEQNGYPINQSTSKSSSAVANSIGRIFST